MKRVICIIITFSLLFSFAACGTKSSSQKEIDETSVSTEKSTQPTTRPSPILKAQELYNSGDVRGAFDYLCDLAQTEEVRALKETYKAELLLQYEDKIRRESNKNDPEWEWIYAKNDISSFADEEDHYASMVIGVKKATGYFASFWYFTEFASTFDEGWVFPSSFIVMNDSSSYEIQLEPYSTESEMVIEYLFENFEVRLEHKQIVALRDILMQENVKIKYCTEAPYCHDKIVVLAQEHRENMLAVIDYYLLLVA